MEKPMVMIVFRAKTSEKQTVDWKKKLKRPINAEALREVGRNLAKEFSHTEQIVLEISPLSESGLGEEEIADNLALGLELGDYHFEKYVCKLPEEYSRLEMAVLLVSEPQKYSEDYHTWAALSNAVRYCKDLFNEPEERFNSTDLFFELQRLTYLGLRFAKTGTYHVCLSWLGSGKARLVIEAQNRAATAVGAAIIKAAGLLKLPLDLRVNLTLENNLPAVNDLLAEKVILIKDSINSEEDAETEFWRLFKIVKGEIENEKR